MDQIKQNRGNHDKKEGGPPGRRRNKTFTCIETSESHQ